MRPVNVCHEQKDSTFNLDAIAGVNECRPPVGNNIEGDMMTRF